MDYELAKELKDAGFPQPNTKDSDVKLPFDGRFLVSKQHPYPSSPTEDGKSWNEAYDEYKVNCAYAPTLEELIEACDFDIELIIYEGGRAFARRVNSSPDMTFIESSTSVEAVARLWLALNKKSEAPSGYSRGD